MSYLGFFIGDYSKTYGEALITVLKTSWSGILYGSGAFLSCATHFFIIITKNTLTLQNIGSGFASMQVLAYPSGNTEFFYPSAIGFETLNSVDVFLFAYGSTTIELKKIRLEGGESITVGTPDTAPTTSSVASISLSGITCKIDHTNKFYPILKSIRAEPSEVIMGCSASLYNNLNTN